MKERGEIWLECASLTRLDEDKKSGGQLNEDMGGWDGARGVVLLTVRGLEEDIVPGFVAKSCPAVNLTKGSREEDAAGLAPK